jgi:prepilin-type N-terminal cleavage/methylation domain-containing protein
MALAKSNSFNSAHGFSLVETMVAVSIMATAIVTLAQLFALSTRTNVSSHYTTYAAVLAEQKLEELRGLSWGFDTQGLPVSDTTTDTSVSPESPTGGKGLSPSPNSALSQNTVGFVDYVGAFGNKLGGGASLPQNAVYTRRWSITPLPTNPNNTLVIQVLVTRNPDRGQANQGNVTRLPEEARMVAVRTRKAQ